MKNVKTVFRIFISREKEKEYLNKMNKKGWKLVSIRFSLYTFVKTEPDEYITVLHYVDRQHQSSFIRTITECGCDIVNQKYIGKSILFYINILVGSEKADFLTDNQSKLGFKTRLKHTRRLKLIALLAGFVFCTMAVIYPLPAIIKILKYAPEEMYKLIRTEPFGCICFAIFVIGMVMCGMMGAYVLFLYCKTNREIACIKNEMKIYE